MEAKRSGRRRGEIWYGFCRWMCWRRYQWWLRRRPAFPDSGLLPKAGWTTPPPCFFHMFVRDISVSTNVDELIRSEGVHAHGPPFRSERVDVCGIKCCNITFHNRSLQPVECHVRSGYCAGWSDTFLYWSYKRMEQFEVKCNVLKCEQNLTSIQWEL